MSGTVPTSGPPSTTSARDESATNSGRGDAFQSPRVTARHAIAPAIPTGPSARPSRSATSRTAAARLGAASPFSTHHTSTGRPAGRSASARASGSASATTLRAPTAVATRSAAATASSNALLPISTASAAMTWASPSVVRTV
jgi:hypothetical protein